MRYPSRQGLVLPVTELGYEIVPHQKRVTTNHHLYWEKEWYKKKPHRQIFRGLLPHIVTMRAEEHVDLHERYSAPVMPRDVLQIDVIDEYLITHGVIDVVRESKTCETYQVTAEQWQLVRGLYRKA